MSQYKILDKNSTKNKIPNCFCAILQNAFEFKEIQQVFSGVLRNYKNSNRNIQNSMNSVEFYGIQ